MRRRSLSLRSISGAVEEFFFSPFFSTRSTYEGGCLENAGSDGTIDEQHRLHLDTPLPLSGPSRVRVIIVFPEEADSTDMDEKEWLRAAGQNPAFNFLKDSSEDRYTLRDGKPFRD